jgi:hypothetical protein
MITIAQFENAINPKFYSRLILTCGVDSILAHKMSEILFTNSNGSLTIDELKTYARGEVWEPALEKIINKGIIFSGNEGSISFKMFDNISEPTSAKPTKVTLSEKRAEAGRKGGLKAKVAKEKLVLEKVTIKGNEYHFNPKLVKKTKDGLDFIQELNVSGDYSSDSVFRYGGRVDFNFNPMAFIAAKYASVGVDYVKKFKRKPMDGHAIHLWVKSFDKIMKQKSEGAVLKTVFHNYYNQISKERFSNARLNFSAQKFLSLNYYTKTDFNNGKCKYEFGESAHDRVMSLGGNETRYAQAWFSFARLVKRVKDDLRAINEHEEKEGVFYSRVNNFYVDKKVDINKLQPKIDDKIDFETGVKKDIEEIAEEQIEQHLEDDSDPHGLNEIDWEKENHVELKEKPTIEAFHKWEAERIKNLENK